MSYRYLPDGTPFTAEELNERFQTEQDNVNTITSDELARGALGASHLPMLIGVSGAADDISLEPVAVADRAVDFETPTLFKSRDLVINTTFSPHLNVGRDAGDDVSALILMANINVDRFITFTDTGIVEPTDNGLPKDQRIEDVLYAIFMFYIVDEGSFPDRKYITKSARSISPGFTQVGNDPTSALLYQRAIQPDNQTFKDVAMRTVILPEETDGAIREVGVEVLFGRWSVATLNDFTHGAYISKRNITCLPIQAKVVVT